MNNYCCKMVCISKTKFCIVFFVLNCGPISICLGADTSCDDSQKHFANLCFSPKPTKDFDVQWVANAQPTEGWHVDIGNDISRLHVAELLKGKLLTLGDNYDDMCLRIKIENAEGQESEDGEFFGFANLSSNWNCSRSQDFPGVLHCDMSSSGLSKYSDKVNIYFSYTDNINLSIIIQCFPNGQVGWHTISVKPLNEKEKDTTMEYIQSLGFSTNNTVSMNNNSCPPVA